jgi:hypothetical protein
VSALDRLLKISSRLVCSVGLTRIRSGQLHVLTTVVQH